MRPVVDPTEIRRLVRPPSSLDSFRPSKGCSRVSPWHNPRPRDKYKLFRRVTVVTVILLALAVLITLVR